MQAKKDNNRVSTMLGLLCTDGVTPVPIAITEDGLIEVDTVSVISEEAQNAKRDENRVPTLMAVSSVDGVTPVPIYVNASGAILIAT